MTGQRLEVEGRYRAAAMRKAAWSKAHAEAHGIVRAWQFLDEDPHAVGDWGEAALCQFLGVDPDAEMFKHDPRLPDVCGIEVKTTIYRNGHLLVTQQRATSEHVLAVVGTERRFVHLVGWMAPEAINDDRRYPRMTRGKAPPTRWIPAEDLDHDMGALWRLVHARLARSSA